MRSDEYPQGLWSFSDFETYRSDWICRHIMTDLDTVFEGARDRWRAAGEPANGRGDFVLAIALFSVFDHIGQFLAADASESLGSTANIARVANRLPSTRSVSTVVSTFGRHALVHNGWPVTAFLMDGGTWAFGLNISADPNSLNEHGEKTHGLLYRRSYPRPGSNTTVPILKYRLNVRILKDELSEAIGGWTCKEGVFVRIRNNAISACQSGSNPQKLREGRQPRLDSIDSQIRKIFDIARRKAVWMEEG